MYKPWPSCWLIGRPCTRHSEHLPGWGDCTEGNCIPIYSVAAQVIYKITTPGYIKISKH